LASTQNKGVSTVDAARNQLIIWLGSKAGLPDFSWHNIPKWGKIYQIATKLPKGHKIYQMAVVYSKSPLNTPTFSIQRPSNIYPNWDFWFENIPSGNPDRRYATHGVPVYMCSVQNCQ
jgi:hypothetical protein